MGLLDTIVSIQVNAKDIGALRHKTIYKRPKWSQDGTIQTRVVVYLYTTQGGVNETMCRSLIRLTFNE